MSRLKNAAKAIARNPKAMRVVDRTMAVALRIASPPYVTFTLLGPARLPSSRKALRRMGVFPIRDHYYEPLFNDAHLTKALSAVRTLPGIDWRHDEQLALLDQLEYADELQSLDLAAAPMGDLDFSISNGGFGAGDAEFLYSMIRHIKPNRVIEVGSGNSTKIAQLALRQNSSETGQDCEFICIEPYEMPWLEQLGVRVIRQRVEEVGLDFFRRLGPNDLLFIDSSHIIRPQGDVLFEYLEVLPTLDSGVFVHVHDIFSPRDYPDQWVRNEVKMWNEQYLLEAILSYTDRYEVVAALNYLRHAEYERLAKVCPYLTRDREPGSFYIRIR
jgi:hypothetical protein